MSIKNTTYEAFALSVVRFDYTRILFNCQVMIMKDSHTQEVHLWHTTEATNRKILLFPTR